MYDDAQLFVVFSAEPVSCTTLVHILYTYVYNSGVVGITRFCKCLSFALRNSAAIDRGSRSFLFFFVHSVYSPVNTSIICLSPRESINIYNINEYGTRHAYSRTSTPALRSFCALPLHTPLKESAQERRKEKMVARRWGSPLPGRATICCKRLDRNNATCCAKTRNL